MEGRLFAIARLLVGRRLHSLHFKTFKLSQLVQEIFILQNLNVEMHLRAYSSNFELNNFGVCRKGALIARTIIFFSVSRIRWLIT